MTSLLELPLEILLRLPYGRTFSLDGARDRDEQWRDDRKNIAALAGTCQALNRIFNPVLYQSLILTTLPIAGRLQLIRTIASRPSLAAHVEDLKLDLFARRFPLRDARPRDDNEDVALEQIDASDGDWNRLLGYLFLPATRNLKRLTVRCTRYERFSCDFPALMYGHIQCYCQGRGIGLDYSGLEQLLQAPKIQQLIISAPYITNAAKLTDLKSSTSGVSCIALRVVMLSIGSLDSIFRVCRNLTSFEFYSASMRAPFLEVGTRDKYITFEQIGQAMHQHKENLDTVKICFPSSDTEIPTTIFGGLTFYHFHRLTKLSIAPEMYLGWRECKHQNAVADRHLRLPNPITFADCLPHCLKELTLYIQQYQRPRNGDGFVLDVVRGVLKQKPRFYQLDSLEISCCKGVIACPHCRITALTYLDRQSTIKKNEVAKIEHACAALAVSFRWTDEWTAMD